MSKSKSEREIMLEERKRKYSNGVKDSKSENIYNNLMKTNKDEVVNLNIDSLHPSPDEWNFYPAISDKKMLEMVLSIIENGLFNPIIVWERDNGYQILSGHNRVMAYEKIVEEYKEEENFDKEKYQCIPAIIYGKDEIDESKAREIIIDTNYIQREEDRSLMPTIVKNRLEIIRSRKDVKGRTIDILAKELGISSTKVYEDHVIATKTIPELNELFFNEDIRKKSLLRLAWFDKPTQNYIYKNYKDVLIDSRIEKLKKGMEKEEIDKCFTEEIIKKKLVTTPVPSFLIDDFKEMAKLWLDNRMKEEA